MNDFKYCFKIILLGDSNCGKTSFTNSLVSDKKLDYNHPTIGVEFVSQILSLKDNTNVKLMIWDTAGQERYRTITKMYYKNIVGVFLFFDLTNKSSFLNLKYWYNEIKKNLEDTNGIIYIIGNKLDLVNDRVVNNEDILNFLEGLDDKNTIKYKEVSVKSTDLSELRLIFTEIAEEIHLKITEGKINIEKNNEVLNLKFKPANEKKKGCCSK